MAELSWIAVDWGTSNLRAWLMDAEGGVLEALSSDQGMGGLAPNDFEPALLRLLAPHLPGDERIPVLACGMVGARQGWIEAPYVKTPCAAPGSAEAARPVVRDPRLDVRILPGVSQAEPADVMRGEETQIAGFAAQEPGFDGVLCLPGTHSKWVHLRGDQIQSFRTVMTGELFALLSTQSVLRFSVETEGWDEAAFAQGVQDALDAPQDGLAGLFALRAGSLLDGTPPETAKARLSGLLLGLELSGTRAFWQSQEVVLIGAPALTSLYAKALELCGPRPRETDGAGIVLAGLTAAYGGGRL